MTKFNIEEIQNLIIEIKGQDVIIDRDVAKLYKVETKRINEAVKNNLNKFPKEYMFELNKNEFEKLKVEKNDHQLEKVKYLPKAFTEQGLYMLATILKSKKAIDTTFKIIETFTKIRKLSKNINQFTNIENKNEKEKIIKNSGKIITELFENDLRQTTSETSFEINFAILKFKHSIKK